MVVGLQRPLDSGFTLLECTRPSGSVCGFGEGRMDLNTNPRSEEHLEDCDPKATICLSGSISQALKAAWRGDVLDPHAPNSVSTSLP